MGEREDMLKQVGLNEEQIANEISDILEHEK